MLNCTDMIENIIMTLLPILNLLTPPHHKNKNKTKTNSKIVSDDVLYYCCIFMIAKSFGSGSGCFICQIIIGTVWPEIIKLFSCSTQLSTKFQLLIKTKINQQITKFLALSPPNVVFIMLINVKMPTSVGILTFISRINFVYSGIEHEKVL